MVKINWSTMACGVLLLSATTGIALTAQTTFKTLHSFYYYTDGAGPGVALVQGTDGNFYGTTSSGGGGGFGTVFKITPTGTLTTLHAFDGTDGAYPYAVLVQGGDGNFYGTTTGGGINNGSGTVFRITPSGTLTMLYSFCSNPATKIGCRDGANPAAGLVQANDGNLYGTTNVGGATGGVCPFLEGCGTVFKITPSGTVTTLYSFCSQVNNGVCTDGLYPNALIQANDRNFYGTTFGGGDGVGTVFTLTPGGALTTLHNFNYPDGYLPEAGLVQATDGTFYGTTYSGGTNDNCNGGPCGTVFKITASGALTTLYNFCSQSNCTDGSNPTAALVQGTDGEFYGTTFTGGSNTYCTYGCGTIFKITPSGTLTTLHTFGTDGLGPSAALIQATNGNFYGTTQGGGSSPLPSGTVFGLSVGLGPFVKTNPAFGKVGAVIKILGTNLVGATSVTFNGTAAAFTVKSNSEITTSVPSGATTGTLQVVTPGGTLSSNVPFRVTP